MSGDALRALGVHNMVSAKTGKQVEQAFLGIAGTFNLPLVHFVVWRRWSDCCLSVWSEMLHQRIMERPDVVK